MSHGFLLSLLFAGHDELPFVEYNGQRFSGTVDEIVHKLSEEFAFAATKNTQQAKKEAASTQMMLDLSQAGPEIQSKERHFRTELVGKVLNGCEPITEY